jgi:glycosyltransferase involved in cell wall biosynthesis
MKNIIHFSQDFRIGKPQLGGYSRILNELGDGNYHIIFTVGEYDGFYNIELAGNLKFPVYQLGLESVNYFSLFKQPILMLRIIFKIHKILIENNIKPEILVGHAQLFNFYILWFLKKLYSTNAKLIWEFNVIWGYDNISGLKQLLRTKIQRISQYLVVKNVDGFIFQTSSCKDFIFNKYNIVSNKFAVLLNAVNIENSNFNRIRNSKAILIYGLLDDLNGIAFIINFIKKYDEQLEFEFHFFGNGAYANALSDLARQYTRVKYFGSLPKNEIPELLGKYRFGLIPRIKTLGSDLYIPTKVVEMLNYGMVVIGSDVRGLTEVIEHNVNGFIFRADDQNDLFILLQNIRQLDNSFISLLQDNGRESLKKKFELNIQLLKQKEFFDSLFIN